MGIRRFSDARNWRKFIHSSLSVFSLKIMVQHHHERDNKRDNKVFKKISWKNYKEILRKNFLRKILSGRERSEYFILLLIFIEPKNDKILLIILKEK